MSIYNASKIYFFMNFSYICVEFYLINSLSLYSSSAERLGPAVTPVQLGSCSIWHMMSCSFSPTKSVHSRRSLRVKMHWYSRFSLQNLNCKIQLQEVANELYVLCTFIHSITLVHAILFLLFLFLTQIPIIHHKLSVLFP